MITYEIKIHNDKGSFVLEMDVELTHWDADREVAILNIEYFKATDYDDEGREVECTIEDAQAIAEANYDEIVELWNKRVEKERG